MPKLQEITPPTCAAPADAQDIVRALMQARTTRTPVPVPEGMARYAPADGERIQQLHVQAMLAQYGGHVIGTKLGGGDMATLAALGMSGPFKGPIFSAFAHASPARLRRDGFFACVVEAEIAVRLGEDIGGHPYLPERDVLVHAIEAIVPSIEIADSRFADFMNLPPAAILADAGFAGAWVHGTPVTDWRDLDLPALQVLLLSGGEEVRSGSGSRVMGDPLHALSLLVADLGRDGRKLRAGQVVSTGTCTLPYMGKAGESIVADFGPLGRVSLVLD
jgi:2-keto-4-pentenoate hydratase